jgi:uncharacterized membrane protein YsdA (DUF1294 family)
MTTLNLSDFIPLQTLEQWLFVWSFLGGAGMVIDKVAAKGRSDRISERVFFVAALLGGFAGVILGGLLARHKTSKGRFWVPVGLSTMLWLAILTLYFFPGLIKF